MRRRWAAGAAALAALVAALGLWSGRGSDHGAPGQRARAGRLGFDWQVGRQYRYRLDYHDDSRLSFPIEEMPALRAESAVDADLLFRVYRRDDDRFLIGVGLGEVRRLTGRGLEREMVTPELAAALARHETLMEVNTLGDILSLRARDSDPAAARTLMRALIIETQVKLGDGRAAAWDADEITPRGVARSRYRAKAESIIRTRNDYSRIDAAAMTPGVVDRAVQGGADIALARGVLARLRSQESVRVGAAERPLLDARTRVSLLLLDDAPLDGGVAGDLLAAPAHALTELPADPDAEARARAAFIDGLGWTDLMVAIAGAGGLPGPDHHRFMARAWALVADHPELIPELMRTFAAADTTRDGRFLVLDILAGAGTPAAQAALRDLLVRPELAPASEYVPAVQRLSFVLTPDAETARFTAREVERQDGDARWAATYALGAVVGKLPEGPLRDQLGRELRSKLTGALGRGDEHAAVAAVAALRNAKREQDLDGLVEAAAGPPAVRAQVAYALRSRSDGEDVLLELAGDSAVSVQNVALIALAERGSPAALVRVAELVLEGRVASANFLWAAEALARMMPGELRQRALGELLANAPPDPELRLRLRELLATRGS